MAQNARIFLILSLSIMVATACIPKIATQDTPQRSGRDSNYENRPDTDLLDAKEADFDAFDAKGSKNTGIDASDDDTAVKTGDQTGENIITIVAGGPVEKETLRDWLLWLAGAFATVSTFAAVVSKKAKQLHAALTEIIDVIESVGDQSRTIKQEIAKKQAQKTPLGKIVNRHTAKN